MAHGSVQVTFQLLLNNKARDFVPNGIRNRSESDKEPKHFVAPDLVERAIKQHVPLINQFLFLRAFLRERSRVEIKLKSIFKAHLSLINRGFHA